VTATEGVLSSAPGTVRATAVAGTPRQPHKSNDAVVKARGLKKNYRTLATAVPSSQPPDGRGRSYRQDAGGDITRVCGEYASWPWRASASGGRRQAQSAGETRVVC